MIKDIFRVPDYYKNFTCKGKECRTCCCGGWNITISMDEYFRLLSVDASSELKRKIDTHISVLNDASPDRYAVISPLFTGECPLRLENGWCGLQCECGEEKLPSVCRYYPRGPRLYPVKSCAISNSCELVIEELIKTNDRLTFENKELSFYFDDEEEKKEDKSFMEKQNFILDELSDRNYKFDERLNHLLYKFNASIDEKRMDETIHKIMDLESKSYSISDYLMNIKEERTDVILERLYELFPEFDIYAEKIFSNHVFFMNFPDSLFHEEDKDLGIGLYTVFTFWIRILYANLKSNNINDFVDITGRYFRVAEHTNLYKNIDVIYSELTGE